MFKKDGRVKSLGVVQSIGNDNQGRIDVSESDKESQKPVQGATSTPKV